MVIECGKCWLANSAIQWNNWFLHLILIGMHQEYKPLFNIIIFTRVNKPWDDKLKNPFRKYSCTDIYSQKWTTKASVKPSLSNSSKKLLYFLFIRKWYLFKICILQTAHYRSVSSWQLLRMTKKFLNVVKPKVKFVFGSYSELFLYCSHSQNSFLRSILTL
jgi:hypothetical protein